VLSIAANFSPSHHGNDDQKLLKFKNIHFVVFQDHPTSDSKTFQTTFGF